MTLLYGGVFDPPHLGHVAVASAVLDRYRPQELVVLVHSAPGHKQAHAAAGDRLLLAWAAFAGLARCRVEPDGHARTIDLLREGRWPDPRLVVGADELVDLPRWKEPGAVVAAARLIVATRPTTDRAALEAAAEATGRPDRVELLTVEPVPVSSSELRERIARGEPLDGLVPPAVAALIREHGLYRASGYTGRVPARRPEAS